MEEWFLQTNQFIELSGIEGRIGGWYPYENAEKDDQTVIYCGFLAPQWGHFLIESVARLWACLQYSSVADKYVFVSRMDAESQLSGNYLEFFELLGVLDKIEIINKPRQYKKVFIPELAYSRNHYFRQRRYYLSKLVQPQFPNRHTHNPLIPKRS